jgi:hypothetical protein
MAPLAIIINIRTPLAWNFICGAIIIIIITKMELELPP